MKLATVATIGLMIAACGGAAAEVTVTLEEDPETTTSIAEPESAPVSVAGAIETSETSLGAVLVDAEGRTFYIFSNDEGAESSCYDQCQGSWPPVAAGPVAGEGIGVAVGSTVRADGSEQLTVNGRPVYLFAGDTGPGDVNGQGVAGLWFVIDPDGEPVGTGIEDADPVDPEEGFYDY